MADKRRHHYVPQFYLRGFTDPNTPQGQKPYLWVRDVKSGVIAQRTPKNLAVEIGYYAVHTSKGIDYTTLEDELAAMEDRAAFALRRYLNRPSGSRGAMLPEIAPFLAWLACRVPWFRRIATQGWPGYMEDMAWGGADVPDVPDSYFVVVNRVTEEQRRLSLPDALAAIRSGQWVASMDQNQVIEMMRLQSWYFQHKHFPALSWTILDAPAGHSFFTSDRPVVWFVPDRGFADSPAALKQPEVELTVPLSAQTALLATASPVPLGTQVHVDDINLRTRLFAERFLASPSRLCL